MLKSSRPKKHSRTYWKKKAIELAKLIVRSEGICVRCGRTKEQGWKMEGAHIISVRYAATCADTENILCLCHVCHRYWHDNPILIGRWFDERFPGKYDRLWEQARGIAKPDFETIYNELKQKAASL